MSQLLDLTGLRFGRLVVVVRAPTRRGTNAFWHCVCDCGRTKDVLGISLRNGDTQSCGCLQRELMAARRTTHGQSKNGTTRTYNSWASMVQRCTNPHYYQYENYGGRGISVCEEWRSFANFYRDMGDRPPGRTLDRIDNNRGYEKSNARWATPYQQVHNRRERKDSRRLKMLAIHGVEVREVRA